MTSAGDGPDPDWYAVVDFRGFMLERRGEARGLARAVAGGRDGGQLVTGWCPGSRLPGRPPWPLWA